MIYTLILLIPTAFQEYRGLVALQYLYDLTFAIVTPLEFLYPMTAYCETSIYQFYDTNINLYNFVAFDSSQIVFNLIRKFGTILFNFMTFWDCFNKLEGQCAGIKSGRFLYWVLDYRNFYDAAKIDEFDAALVPITPLL